MDRSIADRIIVKSNERMDKVRLWWLDNKEWLARQEWHAPIQSGIIELQEEGYGIEFEEKNDIVELTLFPLEHNGRIPPIFVIFDYDPVSTNMNHYCFAPGQTQVKQDFIRMTIFADHTDAKAAMKYTMLMQFMAHYREVITVEEKKVRKPGIGKKKHGKSKRPAALLAKRIFVVENFDHKTLPSPAAEKRNYTKPDHEVNVRGYYRHYKSGKQVWIEPYTRYKEKGNRQSKVYELQEVSG